MGENIPQLPLVDPLGAPVASVSKNAFERLTSREFVPHELLSLIEEFLMSENVDRTIRSLAEDDAQEFIDVIDEALENSELSPWAKTQCLQLLYRTCGLYALLPKTMKIPDCCDRTGVALYRGGYADVWKGKYRGREVAVKVVRTYRNSDLKKILGRFCKEVVTWRTLQHPNVLPLIGVTMSESQFAMISDWMPNGNINEFVEANPSVNRLKLLGDVARGLIYIHEREMTHGDLKGANILIDQASNARLADFGLLTVLSDPANILPPSSYTQGGTARWMGPELIAPKEFGLKTSRPTKASDCYSLGMVIYEAISGSIPFHEDTDLAVFLKVVRGERPSRGAGFPEGLWEKLEQCWKPHPDARPSVEDVLQCLERCNLPVTGAHLTGDSPQGAQMSTGTGHDGDPRGSEGFSGTSARGEIVVRCICGDDFDRKYDVVQCNKCMVRQHATCMRVGVQAVNTAYFCEKCRPDLHQDLLTKPPHQHSKSIGGTSDPYPLYTDLLARFAADTTFADQPSTSNPPARFTEYSQPASFHDYRLPVCSDLRSGIDQYESERDSDPFAAATQAFAADPVAAFTVPHSEPFSYGPPSPSSDFSYSDNLSNHSGSIDSPGSPFESAPSSNLPFDSDLDFSKILLKHSTPEISESSAALSSDDYSSSPDDSLGVSTMITNFPSLPPRLPPLYGRIEGATMLPPHPPNYKGGVTYPCLPPLHAARFTTDNLTATERRSLRTTQVVPTIQGRHRRNSSGSRDRSVSGPSGTREGSRINPYPSPGTRTLAEGGHSSGGMHVPGINSTTAVSAVDDTDVMNTALGGTSGGRRRTDANFVCPVPGCGSSFKLRFSLKGHMRSRHQENPFPCRWPGCGKRFATAHYCKRHERLHPNKCEGCGKSFQGMDALSQHQGGQDCHKAHGEAHPSDVD